MARLHITILYLLTILSLSSAHFQLNYPATIGFNDENEGSAPCGGFPVSFSNTTEFHVGGDTIALTSGHPQSEWLFRATLDKTASGNWTDLLPVVGQSGIGSFCETGVMVPTTWAGQQGIIQVVQKGADGGLYQCAAVNYTSGIASSIPSSCTNATGSTATFTSDVSLSSLPATATPSTASSSTSGAGTTTAASSGTDILLPVGFVGQQGFWLSSLVLGAVVMGLGLGVLNS